jgi:hypothetical protein
MVTGNNVNGKMSTEKGHSCGRKNVQGKNVHQRVKNVQTLHVYLLSLYGVSTRMRASEYEGPVFNTAARPL